MSEDDGDKTIFGGKLPDPNAPRPATPGSESPFDTPPPKQPPAARPGIGDDRTVIGGALPPQQPGGGRVAPTGPPGGFHPTPPPQTTGNTWLGGALPQNPPGAPAPGPGPGAGIGSPGGAQEGFFPDIPSAQPAPQPIATPRISLDQALRGTGLGKGGSSNPLVAAAANLLILFGRLRTGMVEMDAVPLVDHVTREIDQFERNAVAAGVDAHEALVAKYALCGTADDIVQNLPGADRGLWIQYSMVARFFQKRDSGVGFFQEAEKAMQAPGQHWHLLELMLICLSLGFEGQYRTLPNGAVELARIRSAIYETLRRVTPRPDEDISVKWLPVILGGKRRFGAVPVWAVAGLAAVALVAFFAALGTLIYRDGAEVVARLNAMHPTNPALDRIAIERVAPGPVFVATSTQLERVQAALAAEIDQGQVSVGTKGEFIYVRVGNLLLFESGQATVKADFVPLAGRIAETLNAEGGLVKVVGFTDSIQPSGRGRYKTNLDLSVARAEGVRDLLAGLLSDPMRLEVEGRGAADPIGDNGTAAGQALNRRVEIMLAREGSY